MIFGQILELPAIVIKDHIFWEGHKILQNHHLTFDCTTYGQKLGGDITKFCGLLRIYELYYAYPGWNAKANFVKDAFSIEIPNW